MNTTKLLQNKSNGKFNITSLNSTKPSFEMMMLENTDVESSIMINHVLNIERQQLPRIWKSFKN